MSDAPDPAFIEEDFLGDLNNIFESVTFEGDPILDAAPEAIVTEERPFADATNPVGDGTCDVCGSPTFRPPGLTKAGRKKRVPKYCDLHAPNARVSPERPQSAGLESQLQRIQEELADDMRLLATLAGPLLPVTGMYVFEQADPFTIALIKLAKNNTRVLRVMHRAAQVAPIYTVAQTVAGAAYAVQVDTKGADAHNTIGRRLGVSRAAQNVYPEDQPIENSNGQVFASGPPRYS